LTGTAARSAVRSVDHVRVGYTAPGPITKPGPARLRGRCTGGSRTGGVARPCARAASAGANGARASPRRRAPAGRARGPGGFAGECGALPSAREPRPDRARWRRLLFLLAGGLGARRDPPWAEQLLLILALAGVVPAYLGGEPAEEVIEHLPGVSYGGDRGPRARRSGG
jgi:hypothetical protein